WRRAFRDDRCLPASVFGPVECCALALLICEGVISGLGLHWGGRREGGRRREVVEGVRVNLMGVGVMGGWRTGREAKKRGQTALSTAETVSVVAGLWIGDRVVSPLFCAAFF